MSHNQPDPELKKLYPSLSDEELLVAEEHLDQYLARAMRVLQSHSKRSGRIRTIQDVLQSANYMSVHGVRNFTL